MQDNPAIAYHVKELNLECDEDEDPLCSWLYQDRAFIDVIKFFSTPDSSFPKLTIDGCNRVGNAQPLMGGFFLPFIASNITHLTLSRIWDTPIEMVIYCVNLITLELSEVTFEENYYQPKQSRLRIPKLQHLVNRFSEVALSQLLMYTVNVESSTLDLSQLKSFTSSTYLPEPLDIDTEQKIIDIAAQSLEDLCVMTKYTFMNGIWEDLEDSAYLRSSKSYVLFPEDSLGTTCRMLSTVQSHSLHYLDIEFEITLARSMEPEVLLDADWADLCSEVTRVMVCGGSICTLKVANRYWEPYELDLMHRKEQTKARTQHQSIEKNLRVEKLNPLQENPDFTFTFSYEPYFDEGCHTDN